MSFRKSVNIMSGVRLNVGKTGISATVGKKGLNTTKKVLSYDSLSTDTSDTIETSKSNGFNVLAFVMTIAGFGIASADINWFVRIIGGIFAFAGAIIFLMDTISNPKWLWVLPVISIIALWGDNDFPWWLIGIHLFIIASGIVGLVIKFVPIKCRHCHEKVTDFSTKICPHCNNEWNSKPQKN